jgi:uncharacterized protein YjiS (DUF1127 family)
METPAMHLFSAQTLSAIFGSRLDKASQVDNSSTSETMTEKEMYAALAAELARTSRQRRRVGLIGWFKEMWSGTIDRAIRTQRELERQEHLIERLEAFPPYLLNDIGVSREDDGRLVVKTELGQAEELFAVADRNKPANRQQASEKLNERSSCAAE